MREISLVGAVRVLAAASLLTACTGDDTPADTEDGSSGTGTTEGQVSGTPPTTNTPDDGADDDGTSGGGTTAAPADSDTTAGDADDGTTEAPATDTSMGACDEPEIAVLVMSEDAEVEDPMMQLESMVLPEGTIYARSDVAEEGTVTYTFDLECDADVIVHGLVWDRFAGFEPQNPDSYYTSMDDEDPEGLFPYGCQTVGESDSVWSWQLIVPLDGELCGTAPGIYSLEAGTHTLRLRNREQGQMDNFAGIAAIVVTNDANLNPSALFNPIPK
ncbi:MAG: hypothetical protein AAF721_16420 [Myxococcota bacterium]